MKTVAIVQARIDPKGFPNLPVRSVNGTTVLGFLLSRLSQSKKIGSIVVATIIHYQH